MPREFPDWINPWTAAQGRRTFGGTIPLKRMKRLRQEIESDEGVASFEMRFSLDMDKRPNIELQVEAALTLMCQASLAPYVETVRREALLGVVESESESALLSESLDPVVVDNHRLALATLVEDELLLALPQVPRNPEIDPVDFSTAGEEDSAQAEDAPEERPNPFAALQGKIGSAGKREGE